MATKTEDYLEIARLGPQSDIVSLHPEASRVITYLKENNIFQNNFLDLFLDIGSDRGKAAQAFYKNFIIYPDKVHLIEPDVISFENIKELRAKGKLEKFHVQNVAFSNKDGMRIFKSLSHIKLDTQRDDFSQISTLHDRDYSLTGEPDAAGGPNLYEVEVIRGETYMKKFNIKNIDFCKIDAEGHTYEILEGFGEQILNIKCIFLETESFEVWKNQKYASDVSELLIAKGFDLELNIARHVPWAGENGYQYNQLWINKSYKIV